jgi:hypothetical protein
MTNVVQLFESKTIKQKDMTPEMVCRVLRAAGLDAHLIDSGLIVDMPRLGIVITIADDPSNKLFYSAKRQFRPRIPLVKRMALANRINKGNVGATYVDKDTLNVWSTLSFEGGILPHNISNTVRDFYRLIESAFDREDRGELRR